MYNIYFLFLVAFYSSETRQIVCTGAIIGNHCVLTTATCLSKPITIEGSLPKPKYPNDIFVVIGTPSMFEADATDSRVIQEINIHPKFKSKYEFNVGYVVVCILLTNITFLMIRQPHCGAHVLNASDAPPEPGEI